MKIKIQCPDTSKVVLQIKCLDCLNTKLTKFYKIIDIFQQRVPRPFPSWGLFNSPRPPRTFF